MRNTLVAILVFIAGLAVGYFARNACIDAHNTMGTQAVNRADMAAIEKLHQADVAVTLTQDPSALIALWSDDGANFGFPGPPVVGTTAMREAYAKFRSEHPDFHVLKYSPDIKQVQIADGWALEVGDFPATFQMSSKESPVSVNDKGMRLLKRQSDGSWKFAVVGLK